MVELGSDKIVIYNYIRSISDGWDVGGLRYLLHTNGVTVKHFEQF